MAAIRESIFRISTCPIGPWIRREPFNDNICKLTVDGPALITERLITKQCFKLNFSAMIGCKTRFFEALMF